MVGKAGPGTCGSDLWGVHTGSIKGRTYRIQGVGQPGHQLGLDELAFAALEGGLLLHGEAGGLHAELVDLVVARLQLRQVGRARLQHRARVGHAGALDLEIGQALQLVVGQGAGRLRTDKNGLSYIQIRGPP